jgi:hypothetical protein
MMLDGSWWLTEIIAIHFKIPPYIPITYIGCRYKVYIYIYETDIISSITASTMVRAVIPVIMYVKIFKTDIIGFFGIKPHKLILTISRLNECLYRTVEKKIFFAKLGSSFGDMLISLLLICTCFEQMARLSFLLWGTKRFSF